MPRPLTLALAVVVTSASCLAQASLHTVAPDGSGDFTTVQAAVDAAASGDVVLLTGGAFLEHVEVVGKGLTITAPGGAGVVAPGGTLGEPRPTLLVRDLPADALVVVDGLQVFSGNGNAPATLRIDDCAGSVWLHDVLVDSYGAPALVADDCASLVVVASLVQTNVVPAGEVGGPGARLTDASAHLYDATLRGSHGPLLLAGMPPLTTPMSGGSGATLRRSSLRASGALLAGSSGTSFVDAGCLLGAPGGHGLVVHEAAPGETPSSAWLRDSVASGAGPSAFDAGCAPPPPASADVLAPPGSVTTDARPARRLDVPGTASAGATLPVDVGGQPDDVAWFFTALGAAPGTPAGGVTLHLDPATLTSLFVLPLGPAGTASFDAGVPALPVGFEVLVVPLQAFFVGSDGARHASGPVQVVIR